MDLGLVKKLQ